MNVKKISIHSAIIIGLFAFALGIILGIVFSGFPPSKDKAAGTIGKVSNYRNVSVTENDIKLRNELLNDTAQRNMLEKYLIVNYAHSVETTNDIGHVLELTSTVLDFAKDNQPLITSLENYNRMLEQSRLDILHTLARLSELNDNKEEPVISYINEASNGVARLHNSNNLMISYASAIGKFLMNYQKTSFNNLKDAHDILLMNVAKSAIITNNEPVLKYLADLKLLTKDKPTTDGTKAQQSTQFDMITSKDIKSLQLANVETLNRLFIGVSEVFNQSHQLEMIILVDSPVVNDQTSLSLLGGEKLQKELLNAEKLGLYQQASNVLFCDQVGNLSFGE